MDLDDMMMRGSYHAGSMATTSATPNTGLSLESLLNQMERVTRLIGSACGAGTLTGLRMPVCEDVAAVRTVPAKLHKKRRGQSEAYHRRVQKKWDKRHGSKQVPAVYWIDNSFLGGNSQTMLVHPGIAAELKLHFAVNRGM